MKILRQKVAIITGCSRGIGRATALKLSEKGILIVANYLKEDLQALSLKKTIEEKGGTCALVKGDIGNPATADSVVKTSLDRYGAIDFLVNNAGFYSKKKLAEIVPEDFDRSIRLNLYAPLMLSQRVSPIMQRQKSGKIVFISSVLALRGYPYSSHYICAKAGLIGLTKSLARELAPYVQVNCVVPGFIETSLLKKDTKARRARRLREIPLHRLGRDVEVAGVIAFLLSGDADYITGEVINVSGGYYI